MDCALAGQARPAEESLLTPAIKHLGLVPYQRAYREMQEFTAARNASTRDEIWLIEHPPVFTLGLAANPDHVLDPGPIPVVRIDRGGQVTYHGPGQLVVYLLLDLKRRRLGVRELVRRLELAVIGLLADAGVAAKLRSGAPGVYVGDAKIAALGLRIRRGCCYHGLALNVAMDLEPFARINPCGYAGLAVTQTVELGIRDNIHTIGNRLVEQLLDQLNTPTPTHSPAHPA